MPSPLDATQPRHLWAVFPIEGNTPPKSMDELAAHLSVSADFARRLYPILVPGTTVVVTELPAVRQKPMQPVLDAVAAKKR